LSCICWTRFPIKLSKDFFLSYGQIGNIVWDTCMFGGYQAKVRIYNPLGKKHDGKKPMDISLIIQKMNKRVYFYHRTHSTRIVEFGNGWFIENGETSGSEDSWNVEIKEVRV